MEEILKPEKLKITLSSEGLEDWDINLEIEESQEITAKFNFGGKGVEGDKTTLRSYVTTLILEALQDLGDAEVVNN